MFDDNTKQDQPEGKKEPQKEVEVKLESKAAEVSKPAESSEKGKDSVHTMPMEYYLGDKTVSVVKKSQSKASANVPSMSNTTGKKRPKALVVGIVVVLALMVLGSAYLLYATYFGGEGEEITNNQAPIINDKEDEIQNSEPETQNSDRQSETDKSREEVVVEEKDERLDLTKLNEKDLNEMYALDTDRDGLTDSEEEMIGSDPQLVDTDNDGFNDQQEVVNLYSPVSTAEFGVVRLYDLEFADLYVNEKLAYKIYYPKDWIIDALDEENPVDVMISSNVNEFINIVTYEKKLNESLKDWYLKQNPKARPNEVRSYQTYNDLDAIESPDGFTVFVAKGNDVLAINYSIGLKEKAIYPNMFKIVVNSLEFLTKAELADLILELNPAPLEIPIEEPDDNGPQFLEPETLGEEEVVE